MFSHCHDWCTKKAKIINICQLNEGLIEDTQSYFTALEKITLGKNIEQETRVILSQNIFQICYINTSFSVCDDMFTITNGNIMFLNYCLFTKIKKKVKQENVNLFFS